MKTRIMFCLVMAVLFEFTGNSFAMKETQEPVDATGGPSEINTTEEYDVIVSPQGTEGTTNTFYGNLAGNVTMTGDSNSFFGRSAGEKNTTGRYNSFFGRSAGYENTIGYNNSFFGRSAGNKNTNGNYNSFFGAFAGHENTTGGNSNSFFGSSAGYSNTEGDANSFFGQGAGYSNETGQVNSFFGSGAGSNITTGGCNSFFGSDAGYTNKTGSRNVFLGYRAGWRETGSYKLYIDSTEADKPLIWGDFNAENRNVVVYGGFKAIASYSSSDGRCKRNIEPLESSLDNVSKLQGVTYEWNTDEYPDFGLTEGKQIGLIAQDVEEVLPELVSEDKDGYKAVSYTRLTAVLVEAVKELKARNERQEAEIEKQKSEIEELRSMIKELKNRTHNAELHLSHRPRELSTFSLDILGDSIASFGDEFGGHPDS